MSNFITSNSDYGIKCIGFIGKYNELLFHHVVEGAIDEAEVHGIMYSSIDGVEERLHHRRQSLYLGHISNGEDCKVFAFCSNSLVKVIVLTHSDLSSSSVDAMKEFCTELYKKYVKALKNPFQDISGELSFNNFRKQINDYVNTFNEGINV